MNILFICDEYPPGLNGGIGTMVQQLSQELVRQGHQVFVVGLYSYRYGCPDYEIDHGVKVFRLRYGLKLPVNGTSRWYNLLEKLPNFIKRNLNGKSAYIHYIDFINGLITESQIDIVEMPDWNTFVYNIGIKYPILPVFNIPLVLKLHGSHSYFSKELNEPGKKRWHTIDRLIWERADAVIAVSSYTASQNTALFQKNKPIKVLYNAIAVEHKENDVKRAENLVFYSGSLVKKKGIFELMHAWNNVIKELPEAQLVVFGKGPMEVLKATLTDKAIASVTFMGHQPRPLLMEYLQKATLAIFPSFSETFGLVAIEAMSTGCPTIFTKLSCGPEIVTDSVNGLLVDPNNIDEIADKILLLLKNVALRNAIGVAGKKSVQKRFDLTQSATDHISFYQGVISAFNLS
jgi:glycogen synthase